MSVKIVDFDFYFGSVRGFFIFDCIGWDIAIGAYLGNWEFIRHNYIAARYLSE